MYGGEGEKPANEIYYKINGIIEQRSLTKSPLASVLSCGLIGRNYNQLQGSRLTYGINT